MDGVSRELQEAVGRLDVLTRDDDAWITFHHYGGGPDEAYMQGNLSGYLRLAVEILKGATAEVEEKQDRLPIEVDKLFTGDGDVYFSYFELDQRPRPVAPEKTRRVRIGNVLLLVGCGILAFCVVITLFVGVNTVRLWFTK